MQSSHACKLGSLLAPPACTDPDHPLSQKHLSCHRCRGKKKTVDTQGCTSCYYELLRSSGVIGLQPADNSMPGLPCCKKLFHRSMGLAEQVRSVNLPVQVVPEFDGSYRL